jgi:ABC-2 type transport system permease protein
LLGGVLGLLLRGVALPIGLGVVWVLGIENLVSGMASSVLSALRPLRDVLPGVNAGSLVTDVMPARVLDAPPGVNSSVAGPRALVTLACYVLVCSAVSLVVTRRRDVV